MTDQTIRISLGECRTLLVKNWDLLSEQTKEQLRSVGIDPDSQEKTGKYLKEDSKR